METISEKNINTKRRILSGSEGTTFITNLGVYKKFHNCIPDEIRLIKIQKLYYLNTLKLIKDYFPELKYIVEENKILGYIMEQIIGFGLGSHEFNFDTKIFLLRNIINKLEILNENDIYVLDLRNPNVIIDEVVQDTDSIVYNPRFLDADGVIINGYPPSKLPPNLNKYLKNGGHKDEKAQVFMFNYYTANVLSFHKTEYDKTGERIIKQLTLNKFDCDCDNDLLFST